MLTKRPIYVRVLGRYTIKDGDLRCQGIRKHNENWDGPLTCNKLLAKLNGSNQIAGDFFCYRCKEHIIIEMRYEDR